MLRRESRYRVLTMTSTLKRDNFKETDDFIQGYFFFAMIFACLKVMSWKLQDIYLYLFSKPATLA